MVYIVRSYQETSDLRIRYYNCNSQRQPVNPTTIIVWNLDDVELLKACECCREVRFYLFRIKYHLCSQSILSHKILSEDGAFRKKRVVLGTCAALVNNFNFREVGIRFLNLLAFYHSCLEPYKVDLFSLLLFFFLKSFNKLIFLL